jgi:hypothetical protein
LLSKKFILSLHLPGRKAPNPFSNRENPSSPNNYCQHNDSIKEYKQKWRLSQDKYENFRMNETAFSSPTGSIRLTSARLGLVSKK